MQQGYGAAHNELGYDVPLRTHTVPLFPTFPMRGSYVGSGGSRVLFSLRYRGPAPARREKYEIGERYAYATAARMRLAASPRFSMVRRSMTLRLAVPRETGREPTTNRSASTRGCGVRRTTPPRITASLRVAVAKRFRCSAVVEQLRVVARRGCANRFCASWLQRAPGAAASISPLQKQVLGVCQGDPSGLRCILDHYTHVRRCGAEWNPYPRRAFSLYTATTYGRIVVHIKVFGDSDG